MCCEPDVAIRRSGILRLHRLVALLVVVDDVEGIALFLELIYYQTDAVLARIVSIVQFLGLVAIVPGDDSLGHRGVFGRSPSELYTLIAQLGVKAIGFLRIDAAARYYPLLVDVVLILAGSERAYKRGNQCYI